MADPIRVPNPQSDAEVRRAFAKIIANAGADNADIATNTADIATNTAAIAAIEPYGRWQEVDTGEYTATPASTSTITVSSLTTDANVGLPVKYSIDAGSTYRYAVLVAVTSSLLTIAGAPISDDIDELYIGRAEMVVSLAFFIAGNYDDAADSDLLKNDMHSYHKWNLSDYAYLVTFSGVNDTADTGAADPRVNVQINNAGVSTHDSNRGITIAGAAGTWNDHSAAASRVAINTSNYRVQYGEEIEVTFETTGSLNNDAEDLTVLMTFVLA